MEKRYRTEWKYICTEKTAALLYERLRAVLIPDPHSKPDGTYAIHSLYFDDHMNSCAADNEAGTLSRVKYRIRCYGTDHSRKHLERKEKKDGRTRKLSCPLKAPEYTALLSGKANELFWQTDDPLLRQFCLTVMTRLFEPKLSVVYQRTALIEPALNVRITFDRDILTADAKSGFPGKPDDVSFPLLPPGNCILEVKFDDVLPGWLRQMIESERVQLTAFSKYYLGRKKLESVYQ